MLTTNTLMNAVEAALKRLYPGEPVYYDELPNAEKHCREQQGV